MTVRYLSEAVGEWIAAGRYYEAQRHGLGRRFDREFEAAIQKILEAPNRWPLERAKVRRYRMTKFPYKIMYRLNDSEVVVVAVAHASRRPGYWADRL